MKTKTRKPPHALLCICETQAPSCLMAKHSGSFPYSERAQNLSSVHLHLESFHTLHMGRKSGFGNIFQKLKTKKTDPIFPRVRLLSGVDFLLLLMLTKDVRDEVLRERFISILVQLNAEKSASLHSKL